MPLILYLYQQYDLRKRGVGNEGENELLIFFSIHVSV
jgi:hypothetical protein